MAATDQEREWAASVMASSDPWIKLGVSLEQARSAVNDPAYRIYIAHREGRPVGLMVLQDKGVAGSPYLKSIAVVAVERGHGTGEALVRFAEELYRPASRHLFLCVSSFNTKARSFYERLGFRQAGEFKDYIIPGYSEALMHKLLK